LAAVVSKQGSGLDSGGGRLMILILEPLSEDYLYYSTQNGNRDNWKAAFNIDQ